jgi:hypothetical protein
MEINFSTLFAGFAFGVFGYSIMRMGWKRSNPWHLTTGILLMAFPYFISNTWLTWGIGIALMFVAYAKR